MKKVTRRDKRKKHKEINFFEEFIKIKNHFFKDINLKLKGVKDKRHQSYIEYTPDIILFNMIMKNVTAIASMNQMTAEFITNIPIKEKNAGEILFSGRSRWKIENEGFNNQKNIKNNIGHLCCKDYNAMKNHYLLVQIADILRQLFECGYELIRSLKASWTKQIK